jgi:hypothetical protein
LAGFVAPTLAPGLDMPEKDRVVVEQKLRNDKSKNYNVANNSSAQLEYKGF